MAEVLENKIPEPEEMPEAIAENAETAPELPEIKSAALEMEYAQELRELLDQLMDMIREENDPNVKKVLIAEYDSTLEKYERLVNPPKAEPDSFTTEVKKRILQSCDKALTLLEKQLEAGEIGQDEYFESLAAISMEMQRYANE